MSSEAGDAFQATAEQRSYREGGKQKSRLSEMFNISILRSLVKPFIIWRNPNLADVASADNRWTPRQLYLDAKGEQAQHKVLEMAVKEALKDSGLILQRTTVRKQTEGNGEQE